MWNGDGYDGDNDWVDDDHFDDCDDESNRLKTIAITQNDDVIGIDDDYDDDDIGIDDDDANDN